MLSDSPTGPFCKTSACSPADDAGRLKEVEAENARIDLVRQVGQPLLSQTRHIAEGAAQRGLGHEPQAGLACNDRRVGRPAVMDIGQFVDLTQN